MTGFYDIDAFPAARSLAADLRRSAKALTMEAVDALSCFSPSPEYRIMDPDDVRLFIMPLRWMGIPMDRIEHGDGWRPVVDGAHLMAAAPLLARLSDNPLVVNAMYSLSMPGCEITPHIDNESHIGDVLRLHLGLNCPAGDCALIVDGERREWRDGEILLFDSARVVHSAFNRTASPRLILILDLDRPALIAGG